MPKTKLSDSKLLEEYSVNHLSVSEIMRKYGYADHTTISRRLTKLGVPSNRHHYMNVPLSSRQHKILFGSMLGDATVRPGSRNCYAKFGHSYKQDFYLEWKHWQLLPFSRPIYYGKKSVEFVTYTLPQFTEYREMFYDEEGKKFVPRLPFRLEPLALAVWYMDDGSYMGDNRVGFATCSFTRDDQEYLLDTLEDAYGLHGSVCNIGGGHYQMIVLSANSFSKFKELVIPHLLPGFYYKVNC